MQIVTLLRDMVSKRRIWILSVLLVLILPSDFLSAQQMGQLNVGGSRNGNIFAQGQRHFYTLVISSPGMYQVDLTSTSMDCFLRIFGNGVNAENDDGGDGLNSRIVQFFNPGTYTIDAGGLGTSTGSYNLTAFLAGSSSGFVQSGGDRFISPGQSVNDNIGFQEEQDWYTFTLSAPMQITITMNQTGGQLDCLLELHNQFGMITSDDDSGGYPNSRISTFLQPGTYRILCRGLSTSTGSYVMSLFAGY